MPLWRTTAAPSRQATRPGPPVQVEGGSGPFPRMLALNVLIQRDAHPEYDDVITVAGK